MFYSVLHDGHPIYETDSEGNIIYDVMPDGTSEPRYVGESPEGYDEPVEFFNSITGTLTQEEIQAYGIEARGMAKMTYHKGAWPFAIGTLIWKDSEVKHNDDGSVDEKSADYRIIGIDDTGRHFTKALMVAVV